MPERKENESIRDYLIRRVEHFMTLPEEPDDFWRVARPTEIAKESALRIIAMIAQTELPEPMMTATLDKGIAFEWNILGRELFLEASADGSGGYLTVSGSEEKEEDNLAIDDAFFDKTVYWLTRNPKIHALRGVHKLMDLPLGESTWSPSRPSEAQKDLAITLILAVPWNGLPIPIISAGGDGTICLQWSTPSRRLLICMYPDFSMEYAASEGPKIKEGDLSVFDTRLAALICWLVRCDEL